MQLWTLFFQGVFTDNLSFKFCYQKKPPTGGYTNFVLFQLYFLINQFFDLSTFPTRMFFIRFQLAHYLQSFFFTIGYPVKKMFFCSSADNTNAFFHFTKGSARRRNH